MQNEEEQKDFYDRVNSLLQEVNENLIEFLTLKYADENTTQSDIIIDLINIKAVFFTASVPYRKDFELVPDNEEEDTSSNSDG